MSLQLSLRSAVWGYVWPKIMLLLGFCSQSGVTLDTEHPIVAQHVRHVARVTRVGITTCSMDVSPHIMWHMSPRNMVDDSVKNWWAVQISHCHVRRHNWYIKNKWVPYIRVAGTTYRFKPNQLHTILLNFEFNDMDMDLDVSRVTYRRIRAKIPPRTGQINSIQERGLSQRGEILIMKSQGGVICGLNRPLISD